MKGRKILSLVLALTMAFPMGISVHSTDVSAKVIDANYKEDVLWSTSFENSDGFKTGTLDTKGSKNVSGSMKSDIKGDLSYLVDKSNLSGSASYNSSEVMRNLFDGNTATKYLTTKSPVEIIAKLKNGTKKAVKYYYIASANDEQNRDPKNWVLQGRNSDSDGWTDIDSRTNETFDSRYQKKQYQISNPREFSQYRLYITANKGGISMTQLSELVFATGNEADGQIEQKGMTTEIDLGPGSAWNQETGKGWSGKQSLSCMGSHVGTAHGYSYNVIYDGLNVTVRPNTNLRYVIFPSMSNGDVYDFAYTQMHMAVDLKFKDGTYLSDLGAVDQNGNGMKASEQGQSRTLTTNQWNEIYSKIGDVANGKVIDKVLVVYDMESHENEDMANFQTYFDDIEIYNQDTPTYSHLSDYVSILRGTNNSPGFSRGLTAPVVLTPQGFNFFAPCTEYRSSELYKYQSTRFKYMTISHEPSYWVGDRGTWQFMVNTSQNAGSSTNFGTGNLQGTFSHENEVAKAHYYKVAFGSDGGDAANSQMELTPTQHGAVVRFTYNNAANKSVIFDCVHADGGLEYSGKTFKAYSDHTSNGSKRLYIYGEFSENPVNAKNNGKNGIATFNSNTVTMKLATSYISYEQAKKNMELEIGSSSFDTIYNQAQTAWDNQLGIITDVKGATYEQLVTLYSCIYRMYAYPNLMSENTGTNSNPVWKYKSPYKDSNAEAVEGKIYINNGFWDTYRTAWSAYGLFTPSKETELLNGLVQHYKDQGWVPRWIAPGGTNSMVGTSSDVIFADALAKGINFDYEDAYNSALRNAATVSSNLTNGGRKNLSVSNFIGYSPGGGESFSWSMEGYINDFGIAQMAKILAEKTSDATKKANYLSEYNYFLNRSKNYSLMFDNSGMDADTKWLKGRESNGNFTTGNYTNGAFDPFFWGSDYTETNAYNMAVSVPQDGIGVANLYGGREMLADKLDTIFTTEGIYNGYNAVNGVGGIHEQKEAREVKLGQYGHSNQPSHHIPYMYLYSSRPWMTQKYVRDVLDRCYVGASFGQGYIGDEDNGEMSAWYVLSSLGIYPLVMGSDEFAIGSPLFKEVTVNLENNKKLVVKANNNSKENVYVDSMYLNGEKYDKTSIKYKDLINGGTIEFNMSSTPNKTRGLENGTFGKTTTDGDNAPQVYKDFTSDADLSGTSGVATIANLHDNSSDTETSLENTTTLMYTFTDKKAVRMITLTSSASGRTPDKAQIYADNGDNNWQLLGEYNDGAQLHFKVWGKYTRPFAIDASKIGKYTRYKVVLTGTNASLAEVELLGYSNGGVLKSDLNNALNTARNLVSTSTYKAVTTKMNLAIENAQSVYNNNMSSDDEVKSAYQKLTEVVDIKNNQIKLTDPSKIEAEKYDDKAAAIVNDGNNIGGVKRNTWVKYENVLFNGTAKNIEINYAGQKKDAGGYVEVYLDSRVGTPVATVDLPTTGENWSNYVSVKTALDEKVTGLHNVYLVFKNDKSHTYVANVDWVAFDVEPLSETDCEDLNILGFQISNVLGGLRTVSEVEAEINGQKVVEFGNVYAVAVDGITKSDMVVDSTNKYVASIKATEKGIIDEKFSDSETATNYVMTMTDNGTTSEALTQKYMIRAYAKLADGSYVYSKVCRYSIYNVAAVLYNDCKMNTNAGHEYLYNNILKVVDSNYKVVDYNWSSIVVK